jgi:hypothetical protein
MHCEGVIIGLPIGWMPQVVVSVAAAVTVSRSQGTVADR